MPNYKYKCEMCQNEETLSLPISTDPNKPLTCSVCNLDMLIRRPIIASFNMNGKESLGGWYKRKTGGDLLGGGK